jgi:hypothetical protein
MILRMETKVMFGYLHYVLKVFFYGSSSYESDHHVCAPAGTAISTFTENKLPLLIACVFIEIII